MKNDIVNPFIAIACGGTGGHLFPGMAVAEALQQRGADTLLLISAKEVDQWASRNESGLETETLPAVGLVRGGLGAFIRGFRQSFSAARRRFQQRRPQAVLAMGGFLSAPVVLAGKSCGAPAFIHEANSIPGRANRWLAPWVEEAFVYFPMAARGLRNSSVIATGMPVRLQIQPMEAPACRLMLGLEPSRPVLLIMGGSQGAAGINDLILKALPRLVHQAPELQFLHLTGLGQDTAMRKAYAAYHCKAVVRPFLTEMELALNTATVVLSRAGASSLAEFAALRLPAILIPYPAAADNHQYFNALAFVETGAARMALSQIATPAVLSEMIGELIGPGQGRASMRAALAQWHQPQAAEQIAERLLAAIEQRHADWTVGAQPGGAATSYSTLGTYRTLPRKALKQPAGP